MRQHASAVLSRLTDRICTALSRLTDRREACTDCGQRFAPEEMTPTCASAWTTEYTCDQCLYIPRQPSKQSILRKAS